MKTAVKPRVSSSQNNNGVACYRQQLSNQPHPLENLDALATIMPFHRGQEIWREGQSIEHWCFLHFRCCAALHSSWKWRRVFPTAISLPVSRCDIADYLGVSVEAVSPALSGLSQRGVIKLLGTDGQHRRSRRP
jgi:Crp-like helix-turn-helix domain